MKKKEQCNNKQGYEKPIERRKSPFGWEILLQNRVCLFLVVGYASQTISILDFPF